MLAGFTILLAPLALIPGYLTHRRRVIVALGAAGAALLLTGATQVGLDSCTRVLDWIEGSLPTRSLTAQDWAGFGATLAGCLLVGAAHAWNRRTRQSARRSCCAGAAP